MFDFKIDFYKLHDIDKDSLTKAFMQGEIKYNEKLINEYYKKYYGHLETIDEIKHKICDDLTWCTTYYEPLFFDEKKLFEEYNFLPFSYQNKNLIALCIRLNNCWSYYYHTTEKLKKYAQEVTKESYKINNKAIF